MSEIQVAKVYCEAMTQHKTYVFTVADTENCDKPTVWCMMTTDKAVHDQDTAEKLIEEFLESNDLSKLDITVEDLAYNMRKNGFAWVLEQYCFELTPVNG